MSRFRSGPASGPAILAAPRRPPQLRALLLVGQVLLIAAVWTLVQPALAAPSDQTVIEAVQLPAWVERSDQRRPAAPGAVLRETDKAITAEGSRMLLRMSDRSLIKLGEKTEFQIEGLASERTGVAGPSAIKATLRLITGVFRYATDYTSKALGNRRDINLKLTTATVGIRGTDFWSMTDAAHDAVCLFEGKVAVLRDDKAEVSLAKPGAFWLVFTGQEEKPAGQATPDQLAKFIGQAEMSPGSGIVLSGGRWRAVAALLPSASDARALSARLQAAGYPAEVRSKTGGHEVRVNQFATQEDAQSVLTRWLADASLGITGGRVALAAN
jgi:hypothetical protein